MKRTLTAVLVVYFAIVAIPACALFATDEAKEEGGAVEVISAADGWLKAVEAAMIADEINPALATGDQWKEYGQKVTTKAAVDAVQAPTPPGEPIPWWKVLGQLVLTYLSVKGGVLSTQLLGGLVTGTRSRAGDNLTELLDPKATWLDTGKAALAILVESHTPKSAVTPEAKA